MSREPIRHRRNFQQKMMSPLVLWGIRSRFQLLSPSDGHVAHALRTLPPVAARCIATPALPLDLHVLSLPLAFILSQDQTLLCIFFILLVRLLTLDFKEINALDLLNNLGTCLYFLSVFSMIFFGRAGKGADCKGKNYFLICNIFFRFFSLDPSRRTSPEKRLQR